MWFRRQKKGTIFRPALALFSVATIAFPSNIFAEAITFTYNGGDHVYSDPSAWTCSPSCAGGYPDNATDGAVDAIINSGQPDSVLLDTPSVITSLGLGGSSPTTSTLTTNGPSLTLGTPADYRANVLAIGDGGALNINSGANVTLDLSGRSGIDASGALVDSGGSISVQGATLTLQNSVNDGNAARVTNNGSISLDATSSLALGADAQVVVDGWGTLTLSGGTVTGSGSASLTNGSDHLIVGNGVIQTNFNNLGFLEASAATLTLANQLTNQGEVDVDESSALVAQGFVNYADELSSSCGCGASFELTGGTAQINGDLTNHAAIVEAGGFGEPWAEVGLDDASDAHVTGNVLNIATSADGQTAGSTAYMWLDNQSSLTVNQNFTNDSQGLGGLEGSAAELDIDNESTVTVAGQLSNLGGSAILMDSYDGGGSTLNANGGLVNNNSFIFLANGSTLNAGQTSPGAAEQPGWALQNVSSDAAGSGGQALNLSLLQVGFPQQLGGPAGADEQFTPFSSIVNVTGGLLNQATSANDGLPTSILDVDSGSILNADRVLNTATNTAGIGAPEAQINIVDGSAMNVTTRDRTGLLTNSASAVGGSAYADIYVDSTSTLSADAVVNSFTSSQGGEGDATITVDGAMTVTGQFSNSGSVGIGAGGTIQAQTYRQTGGDTYIEADGTLVADVELAGGVLSGDGTIVGNVVVDGGTLAPGDPQSIDIIGNYTQTLEGILDIDIAGSGEGEYDQINVMSDDEHPDGGNVWLGGTLELTLEDGFGSGIHIGDLFHILTWTGAWSGSDFDWFHNQTFSNGTELLTFREVFGDHGLDLAVIDASVATPEPSTLAMLFGAMLLMGGAVWMRRRRNALT
jgi:hypothetical protein